MNTSYLETCNILWTFIPIAFLSFLPSSYPHSILQITAEVIILKFIIEQVILIVQILHSIWITYIIKWKKKNVHALQGLHSMLLLYCLRLIKNEHTHTHISSCLQLTFSFFEYICIRFLSISKPSTWCFLCLDHPALGSSKGHSHSSHVKYHITPER